MPANCVGAAPQAPERRRDDGLVSDRPAREPLADFVCHDDGVRLHLHGLVEAEDDRSRRGREAFAKRRRCRGQVRVRVRRRGRGEHGYEREREGEALHRCGAPAAGERWPKTGAVSRSLKRKTAATTKTSANPVWNAGERGRRTRASGKTAPTRTVQPIAWWRNA